MNRLVIINDFEEVKSIAHQIDADVSYLEQKLSNVSRFGLSLKPEETRAKSENLLNGVQDEIDCMKCNIESCSEEQKQILVDTIADNNSIQDFLEKTRREVIQIEEFFRSRKDYQPYIPYRSEEDCDSPESEQLMLNSHEKKASMDLNATSLDYHNHKKNLSSLKNASATYINSPRNVSFGLEERKDFVNSRLNVEKSLSDLRLSCYNNALKPRKLNTADDTLRTPGNFAIPQSSMKRRISAKVKNGVTSVY